MTGSEVSPTEAANTRAASASRCGAIEREALASRWARVEGRRIHARVGGQRHRGRATPLVLVHGLIVSSRYLVPLGERLAGQWPVFAPDLPGFGLSESPPRTLDVPGLAQALERYMEAAGLTRAVLVGHSMGCQIALELAAERPERVAALVLVGPTSEPGRRNPLLLPPRLMASMPLEKPSLWLSTLWDVWDAGIPRGLRTYACMLTDRPERRLARVRAPALVVRGTLDTIVSDAWVERMARELPQGELARIAWASHALHYSRADALVDVMTRFLARTAVHGA